MTDGATCRVRDQTDADPPRTHARRGPVTRAVANRTRAVVSRDMWLSLNRRGRRHLEIVPLLTLDNGSYVYLHLKSPSGQRGLSMLRVTVIGIRRVDLLLAKVAGLKSSGRRADNGWQRPKGRALLDVIRRKINYANVASTLALFTALGGTSYAAMRSVPPRSNLGR